MVEPAPMAALVTKLKRKLIAFLRRSSLDMDDFVLCSECFRDQGLKLDAQKFGVDDRTPCVNCHLTTGRKLTKQAIVHLSHRFFVWGTLVRCEYGAAPRVQFNDKHETDISTSPWFADDLRLIETKAGVGFFYYGPRLWMVGEVEPLKALQKKGKRRRTVVDRIMTEYPSVNLSTDQIFYRIRKSPKNPTEFSEYDSPPLHLAGSGRLDSKNFPIMYGSQDLPICVQECRATAGDDLFVATLGMNRDLKLLDLTQLLYEEGVTEFDSLDMAVHMLFLAGVHAYPITRSIAGSAKSKGYDGLVYPSYFSLLRT
jgi:hypothetical protein